MSKFRFWKPYFSPFPTLLFMKTRLPLPTLLLATITYFGCDKCDDPLNTACPKICDKVVRLKNAPVWGHTAGQDFFTIDIEFDKDIDAAASGFANQNGIVIYKRADTDPATQEGSTVAGSTTGAGKNWKFTSVAIGEAAIKDPLNYFELAVENNGSDGVGVRTVDGGVFDADSDCNNLTSEHREFKQF